MFSFFNVFNVSENLMFLYVMLCMLFYILLLLTNSLHAQLLMRKLISMLISLIHYIYISVCLCVSMCVYNHLKQPDFDLPIIIAISSCLHHWSMYICESLIWLFCGSFSKYAYYMPRKSYIRLINGRKFIFFSIFANAKGAVTTVRASLAEKAKHRLACSAIIWWKIVSSTP
jgi:hypothetical protein